MPRLQFGHDRGAKLVSLLVWQGSEPEVDSRSTSTLVRTNMLQTQVNMPSSLHIYGLPCGSMSAVRDDGTKYIVLLREAHFYEALRRDRLHQRMELLGTMRRSATVWRA